MSTLKTTYLQHPSSTTANLTLDSGGGVSGGLPSPNRNLIVNGNMTVQQRGSSFTFGTGGGTKYYAADRFNCEDYTWSAGSNITFSNDSTIYPSGFSNSIKMATGATPLTLSSGGFMMIRTTVEGYNIAPYYESTLTLSFWVRSSAIGTYNIFFGNGYWGIGAATRALTKEYTINQADTWEKKTISIDMSSATASGTWNKTNGNGLDIQWILGANADRTGDSYKNSWSTFSSYSAIKTSSAINWTSNANATFYLAGVQLEKGSVATEFEREAYSTTLQKCMRYYETSFSAGTAPANGIYSNHYMHFISYSDTWSYCCPFIPFKVPKRAIPSAAFYGTASNTWQRYNSDETYTSMAYTGSFVGQAGSGITTTGMCVQAHNSGASGLAVGTVRAFRGDWAVSAEL